LAKEKEIKNEKE